MFEGPKNTFEQGDPMAGLSVFERERREAAFEKFKGERAELFGDVFTDVIKKREGAGDYLEKIPQEFRKEVGKLPYAKGAIAVLEGVLGRNVGEEGKLDARQSILKILVGSALIHSEYYNRREKPTGWTEETLQKNLDEACASKNPDPRAIGVLTEAQRFAQARQNAVFAIEGQVVLALESHG